MCLPSWIFAETNKIICVLETVISKAYERKKYETGARVVANCVLNRDEVDSEILSSRKWTGRKPALIPPARWGKDAQMCLSRGIIKRVAVTLGDRNEVGNNVSDTRLVCGFAPTSVARPSTLHSPFRPPPPDLPLYACPPQIQTPN